MDGVPDGGLGRGADLSEDEAAISAYLLRRQGEVSARANYTFPISQRLPWWRRTAARGDTDVRSVGSGERDARPARRPAVAGRTRLLAVRRRCARRRPARARDLHAAR